MSRETKRSEGEVQPSLVEELGLSAGDRKALGLVRSDHATASRTHKINIAIAGAFTLLPGGAAILIGLSALNSPPGSGLGWAALFFAGLAVLPAIGLFFLVRKLSWRLVLFKNGFVFVRGREIVVLWDDVKSLFVGGLNIDQHLDFHLTDDSRLKVDNSFKGFAEFAAAVRGEVAGVVLARADGALAKGEAVPFGKLQVTRGGLEQEGKGSLPWQRIARVVIEDRVSGNLIYGAMVVYAKGKPAEVEWAAKRISNFPNLDAFAKLVERLGRIGIDGPG